MLAALAIGATPFFAQAANDNPNAEPPAGGRIPAASDTPQHSGDTSSDQKSSGAGASQAGAGDAAQATPQAGGASDTNRDRPPRSEAEQNQGQGKSSGQGSR
jgi:hypothetical protein